MVGIHYDGRHYEGNYSRTASSLFKLLILFAIISLLQAVPWANGFMDWNVTWGYWNLTGRSTSGDCPFDVELVYECDSEALPGLVFRYVHFFLDLISLRD